MHLSKYLLLTIIVAFVLVSSSGCGADEGNRVQVIVFDVGGVLSKDMIDTKLRDLAATYDLDIDALLGEKSRFRDLADLGEISDGEFWVQILDRFGVEATQDDKEIDSYIELVDGTLDIAEELSRKYRTAILSNDSIEMSTFRRKKFGFDALFDPIVISGNVGVKKPDTRIYEILLEEVGLPAEECLFIDNNADNVAAAQSLGINAILFTDSARLREELPAFGIEVGE